MAWSAPAIAASGAKSPPIASSAMRAKLRFPGCYSLLPVVVAAFAADVVRAPHRLAARARLNDDGGCGLVRVAGALLPLRGAAFRDGHGSGVASKGRAVSGIGRGRSAASSQRLSVAGAQSHAPAFRSAPQVGQSPLQSSRHSANAGTASSHCSRSAGRRSSSCALGVHDEDIGIVSAFRVCFHEQELHVFGDRHRHVGQTTTTLGGHLTFESGR